MKKRTLHHRKPRSRAPTMALLIGMAGFTLIGAAIFLTTRTGRTKSADPLRAYVPRPTGTVTFSKDIAPVLFRNCAACHQPGQAAPFSLISYADAKKRAQQIAEITQNRVMPPWLPAPDCCGFTEQRLLTTDELGLIQQWVADGAVEGNPADLPVAPKAVEGWQLGKPDLVIQMPEEYVLSADGSDIYRNFVIPIPLTSRQYVNAVEFQPGNRKVVHHAAMKLDRTIQSRRMDEKDSGPGFSGMYLPEGTETPGGHFLNWQPGKLPYFLPDEFAWTLDPKSDFVLQLHMQPTGKPETVQSSIAFYFSQTPPVKQSFKLVFDWPAIDIAPGETNYVITDSYVLPADVDALAVFPHAHYLAREMRATASLPDGSSKTLLHIPQWNFNWQGDYRYTQPVFLPRGTTVTMQFSYDNSTNNVRNPSHPPRRVRTGWLTTDEMGELWLQVVPRNQSDLPMLARDFAQAGVRKMVRVYQQRVVTDPNDGKAYGQLGKALFILGRIEEAIPHLQLATRLDAPNDEPHYLLGVVSRMKKDFGPAKASLESALRLNPENFKAHGNLGLLLMEHGDMVGAEAHLREALRLNPDDAIARKALADLKVQNR